MLQKWWTGSFWSRDSFFSLSVEVTSGWSEPTSGSSLIIEVDVASFIWVTFRFWCGGPPTLWPHVVKKQNHASKDGSNNTVVRSHFRRSIYSPIVSIFSLFPTTWSLTFAVARPIWSSFFFCRRANNLFFVISVGFFIFSSFIIVVEYGPYYMGYLLDSQNWQNMTNK